MDNLKLSNRKSEKGFTLVELAVVMIIIGILIGGILKGQEMIENARVTTAASDLERFGAAYNSFLDKYNVQPGDMGNATTRLADCGSYAACDDAGAPNDGIIDVTVGGANSSDDGVNFWGQLLAAGLISGMDGTAVDGGFGISAPSGAVAGSGYKIGDVRSGVLADTFPEANMRNRPYVVLDGVIGDTAADTGALTADQASSIDSRLDDGNPQVGVVVGVTQDASCVEGGADTTYTGLASPCAVAYRM